MTMRGLRQARRREAGVSLFLIALGLTVLMGIAGLALDLATLYVARNEAQRSADAAALAGAQEFLKSGFSSGAVTDSEAAMLAAAQAAGVGNQNLVIGRNPNFSVSNFTIPGGSDNTCSPPPPSNVSGGCFNFTTSNDPQITVVAAVNMPTYFMRIFGITSVPVSATATAEGYNGPNVSVPCVKPWLLANCDPNFGGPQGADPNANTFCPCSSSSPCGQQPQCPAGDQCYADWYVVPPGQPNAGAIVHPQQWTTGAIGELRTIKPGSPTQAMVPSQFLPVFLTNSNTGAGQGYSCPSCAANDQSQAQQGNSAALYRENIECCSTTGIACGQNTISAITGNKVGPTGQAVDCLIHEQSGGVGQDCVSFDPTAPVTCPGAVYDGNGPYTMYAGSNNPYPGVSVGQVLQVSDSLVTLPLYDGYQLCSGGGNSCPSTQTIDVRGFLGIFITQVVANQQDTVYGYTVSITSCGTGGNGTPIPSTPGSPLVVRLIHN